MKQVGIGSHRSPQGSGRDGNPQGRRSRDGAHGARDSDRQIPEAASQSSSPGTPLHQRRAGNASQQSTASTAPEPEADPVTEQTLKALQVQFDKLQQCLNADTSEPPSSLLKNTREFYQACHDALESGNQQILERVLRLCGQTNTAFTPDPDLHETNRAIYIKLMALKGFGQAMVRMLQGKYEGVDVLLINAVESGVYGAHYWLGLLYLRQGSNEEAITQLKYACDHGVASALNRLGLLLYENFKECAPDISVTEQSKDFKLTEARRTQLLRCAVDAMRYGEPSLLAFIASWIAAGSAGFPKIEDYGLFLLDQAAAMNSADAYLIKFLVYLKPGKDGDTRALDSQPLEALDCLRKMRQILTDRSFTRNRYQWLEKRLLGVMYSSKWPELENIQQHYQKSCETNEVITLILLDAVGISNASKQKKAQARLSDTIYPEFIFWGAALAGSGLIPGNPEQARLNAMISLNRNWPAGGTLLGRLWAIAEHNEARLGLAASRFSNEEEKLYNCLSSAWFFNHHGNCVRAHEMLEKMESLEKTDKAHNNLEISYHCELTRRNITAEPHSFSQNLISLYHPARLDAFRKQLAEGKKGCDIWNDFPDLYCPEGRMMHKAGDAPRNLWTQAMHIQTPRQAFRLLDLAENDLLQVSDADRTSALQHIINKMDEKECFALHKDAGCPAVVQALRSELCKTSDQEKRKNIQQLLFWLTSSADDAMAWADLLVGEGETNKALEMLYSCQARLNACLVSIERSNKARVKEQDTGTTVVAVQVSDDCQRRITELAHQISKLRDKAASLCEQAEKAGLYPMVSFYQTGDVKVLAHKTLSSLDFSVPVNKKQSQQAIKVLNPIINCLLLRSTAQPDEPPQKPFSAEEWAFERCLSVLGHACHHLELQSEATELLNLSAGRSYKPAMYMAGLYSYYTNRFQHASLCFEGCRKLPHEEQPLYDDSEAWRLFDDSLYYQIMQGICFPGMGSDEAVKGSFEATLNRVRILLSRGLGQGCGALMGRMFEFFKTYPKKIPKNYRLELERSCNAALAVQSFRALEPLLTAIYSQTGQQHQAIDPLAVVTLAGQARTPFLKSSGYSKLPTISVKYPLCRASKYQQISAMERYLSSLIMNPQEEQVPFVEVVANVYRDVLKFSRVEGAPPPDVQILSFTQFFSGCVRGNRMLCVNGLKAINTMPVGMRLLAAQMQVYGVLDLGLSSSQINTWLDEAVAAGYATARTCKGVKAFQEERYTHAEKYFDEARTETESQASDTQAGYFQAQWYLRNERTDAALELLDWCKTRHHVPGMGLLLSVAPTQELLDQIKKPDGWVEFVPQLKMQCLVARYRISESQTERDETLDTLKSLANKATAVMLFELLVFLDDEPAAQSVMTVNSIASRLSKAMRVQDGVFLSFHYRKGKVMELVKDKASKYHKTINDKFPKPPVSVPGKGKPGNDTSTKVALPRKSQPEDVQLQPQQAGSSESLPEAARKRKRAKSQKKHRGLRLPNRKKRSLPHPRPNRL